MKKILLILAVALFAMQQPIEGKKLPKKEMAIQLYSIRELIGDPQKFAQNHVAVFKQLKEMGYTAVEAANYDNGKFYGLTPEAYKAECEAAGLKPISSHSTRGLSDEEIKNPDFTAPLQCCDQCIAAPKAAGCTYLITPWGPVPKNLKEAQVWCDYHSEMGKRCHAAALKYGYHTHSHEFQKVEDKIWIEYMLDHVDAANMFWQMDVYWCVMAQQAPIQWFKKYPGRFALLHIKDKFEVGQSGMVGYDPIFSNASLAGMKNYVVELEGTDGTIDIMEGVRRSAEYLRSSQFVKASYTK